MKILLCITLNLCCIGIGAYCQTFSEWWRQKKTRIKYLQKQIAALKELGITLEAGYVGAEEGVDTIAGVTEEELADHKSFYTRLLRVKPAIKDSAALFSCFVMADTLGGRLYQWTAVQHQHSMLSAEEIKWIGDDLLVIIKGLKERIQELLDLVGDGNLEMNDEERWKAVGETEVEVRRLYQRGMVFLNRVNEIIAAREQQAANKAFLKNILP